MTFSEFGKVLARYWFVLVIVSGLLGVSAAAYTTIAPVLYEAKSYVVVSDPSGGMSTQNIASVVESTAIQLVQDEGLANVSVLKVENKIAAEMDTVAISVHGDSAEQCVQSANEIADKVTSRMKEYFSQLREDFEEQKLTPEEAAPLYGEEGDSWDFRIMQDLLASDTLFRYCTFAPIYAQSAEKLGSSTVKLVAAGVAAGFVVALCALACYAGVRRPLTRDSAQSTVFNLPVLNFGNGSVGESSLVSIKLLGKESLSRVVLVPLSMGYADDVAVQLRAGSDFSDLDIELCDPLDADPGTAITARESGGVILCAKCWKDSALALQSTIERFKGYGVNPLGVILLG